MRARAILAVIFAAAALAGCQSTVLGTSRLVGEDLDAAVALYGPWNEQITLKNRPVYIWRRVLLTDASPKYCELRVQLGFRRTISSAYMQGVPAACELYAVRSVSATK
jgi:hypothetical protein